MALVRFKRLKMQVWKSGLGTDCFLPQSVGQSDTDFPYKNVTLEHLSDLIPAAGVGHVN